MSDAAQAFEWLAAILDQQIVAASDAGAAAFRTQDKAAAAQALTRLGELQELQQQFSALQQRWRELAVNDDDGDAFASHNSAEHGTTREGSLPKNDHPPLTEPVLLTEPQQVADTKRPRLKAGQRTPEHDYYVPILTALVEYGGAATARAVLMRVEQLMKGKFRAVDYEILPGVQETPRWYNSGAWARQSLVVQGLMLPKRRTGIWEISEAGRKWLAEQG